MNVYKKCLCLNLLFRKAHLRLLKVVASLEGAKVTKGCKRKVVRKALMELVRACFIQMANIWHAY